MDKRICMVHGRFQPFTIHHMHYIKQALREHSDRDLIIAITNPTVETTGLSEGDDHRHLKDANPYTFEQRKSMIETSIILDKDIVDGNNTIYVVPFPINTIIDEIKSKVDISVEDAKQIVEQQTTEIMKKFNYESSKIESVSSMLKGDDLLQYMIVSDRWGIEKRTMFEKAGYTIETIEYPRITSGSAVRYLQNNKDENWKRLVPEGTKMVIENLEKSKKIKSTDEDEMEIQ